MRFDTGSIGCGASALTGLTGCHRTDFKEGEQDKFITDNLVQALSLYYGKLTVKLVYFGDGVAHNNGAAFADFIIRHKLGTIQASEIVTSPVHPEKSHKGFQAWFWHVDLDEVYKFYVANKGVPKPSWGASTFYAPPVPPVPPLYGMRR